MRIETFYGAESKQYHHRCLHCGKEIRDMMGDEVDMHALGWCVIGPKNMLNAPGKHGVSLGEHHDLMQEAARKTARWKAWTDAHYHEIMLTLMILDVILLTWIAIKK